MPDFTKHMIARLFLFFGLCSLIPLVALSQSKVFFKEVDLLKKDLNSERWTILEEILDSSSTTGALSLSYRDYLPGTRYAFIALLDDCDSCFVDLNCLIDSGVSKDVKEEIDRAEGITRAGYYFELSDEMNASFGVNLEADKPRAVFVVVASY